MENKKLDITKNIRIIEWLKSELLSDLSQLFSSMLNFNSKKTQELADILANMIVLIYLLAHRLGISYDALDMKVLNKLKLGIIEDSESEEWYNELSNLSKHIDKNRNIRR